MVATGGSTVFGHSKVAFFRLRQRDKNVLKRDLFTVVCVVTWPLNESEAGVNLVMMQTSLLFLC